MKKNNEIAGISKAKKGNRKTTSAYADMACAKMVENVLDIPLNGLVDNLEVSILALPAGNCLMSQVAEIRPSESGNKAAIVDLKRMRSVGGVSAAQSIESITPWTGADFSSTAITSTSFSEISTEKLLIKFTSNLKEDELSEKGKIILPDPPLDLILTINDKTLWTNIGPVKLSGASEEQAIDESTVVLEDKNYSRLVDLLVDELTGKRINSEEIFEIFMAYEIHLSKSQKNEISLMFEMSEYHAPKLTKDLVKTWLESLGVISESMRPDTTTPRFEHTVDISSMLQDEIDSGKSKISLKLTSAIACKLELTVPEPNYRYVHDVIFPAQALAIEAKDECKTKISLPLPATSSNWQVEKFALTVEGTAGQSRIYPAVGPSAASLGELLVDSDHALAALLSSSDLENFQSLEGVRLPFKVEAEGAEVTALLRKNNGEKPGEFLEESSFTPLTIEASDNETWFLLQLAEPYELTNSQDIWLEINVIRGKCWWQLGQESDGVSLCRGVPGGPFTPFNITLNQQEQQFYGRLRLMGKPIIDGTIPAIIPLTPGTNNEIGGITTGRSPIDVVMEFSNSVTPSNGKLDLPIIIHAPGSYTFSNAKVIYKT